jgi:undecaprenyl diphosphate synthase
MNAPTGPVNLTEHREFPGETGLRAQAEPGDADSPARVPRHVAIIMDGNGRWAENRGMPRLAGHREGVNAIPKVVDALAQRGVQFLTIYAFSTENWSRPTSEVEGIVQLLRETLQRETDRFNRKNVRVVHIGNAHRLSPDICEAVEWIQQETSGNTGLVLNVAFDYGGRQEILAAVKSLLQEGVSPDAVTEELFSSRLFTAHSPDPDLIIRTGGELRISNFLLWQSAYSEYFHTPVLWPDLDEAELDRALASYGSRQRRFGNVVPDAGS